MARGFCGMSRRAERARVLMEALEARQLLTVVMVTSAGNAGAGTLREAIASVNALTADEIQFAANVKKINLLTELQTITAPVTISGGEKVTINAGNKDFRIFTIDDSTGADIAVTIQGLTLTGGKPNGNGGAIFSLEALTLTDVAITKNRASFRGGAVYSGDGTLTINNCAISSNKTTENGGAIYATNGTLAITNSTISTNSAAKGGGAWCDSGNLNITNSLFSKNSAVSDGGGLYFGGSGNLHLFDSTVASNTAKNDGGGVFSSTSGTTTIDTTLINLNKTTELGGGVFHTGGALVITNSNFNQNAAHKGGGVWSDGSNADVDDFGFNKNTATTDGGAIFYNGAGHLNLTGGTFDANTAGINGGAIWCEDAGATSAWQDFTFKNNKAKQDGGAAWLSNSAAIDLVDGLFRKNSAVDGGAIWNEGTPMSWEFIVSLMNTAVDMGGALYYTNSNGLEDVELNTCTFTGNTAHNGGAINNDGGIMNILSSQFDLNKAGEDGGGMFNNGTAVVVNSTFYMNKAQRAGGFMNFTSRTATLRNNTFVGNIITSGQGGGILNFNGTMRIDSNLITGNKRGATANDIQGSSVNVLSSNNLIGDPSVSIGLAGNTNNIIGQNALTLPFGNYGGKTKVIPVAIGSPAIDAGNNLENLLLDQRDTGFDRQVGAATDIGAYENEWVEDYVREVFAVNGTAGTYDDAGAKAVTVGMTGSGVARVFFDTLLDANPAQVEIYNTDGKSKIKFTVAGAGSLSSITGDVNVHDSIGELNAAPIELGGGAQFRGTVSSILFSDLEDDHNINIDGVGATSKSAVSIKLGWVAETTITSAIPISLLQMVRWDDGGGAQDTITAPRIDKLVVTGQKNITSGDFEASLNITGTGQNATKPVLGSVAIAGTLGGGATRATWDIAGSVGTMNAAKILDTDINVDKGFKSLIVKPAAGVTTPVYINSNLMVLEKLTSAKLGKVQTDNTANAGDDFGVAATAYGTLEYVDGTGTKKKVTAATALPLTDVDFIVTIPI